ERSSGEGSERRERANGRSDSATPRPAAASPAPAGGDSFYVPADGSEPIDADVDEAREGADDIAPRETPGTGEGGGEGQRKGRRRLQRVPRACQRRRTGRRALRARRGVFFWRGRRGRRQAPASPPPRPARPRRRRRGLSPHGRRTDLSGLSTRLYIDDLWISQ